jgi:predicted nucleotidyltransferase component of viral defense system
MLVPELSNFLLTGGTALSLLYGHRLSIDIDLFSSVDFDNEFIAGVMSKNITGFSYLNLNNPIGIFGFIDNLKVDLVKHYHHPLIGSPSTIDGIRFMSTPDIIAMKVNAILRRGVKKDFWDIALLLGHYNVQDFLDYYTKKYPSQHLAISIPSAMTYFEDAEESEDPISLKGQTWESVKKFIQIKVSDYLS